eukprot:CAMPEP_0197571810 /NCGR_PEP_ID=MMETSP1320-20131121/42143_1 /TAXON_ID=91990 /ORGANISM="Bolidomonas sp., Strain RCC2347" /LENGTH=534 /DNA_ID=CAMNT_0043134307 /DNA_START=245 /DNA_END=1846 /DNA_ORIENTATION=-
MSSPSTSPPLYPIPFPPSPPTTNAHNNDLSMSPPTVGDDALVPFTLQHNNTTSTLSTSPDLNSSALALVDGHQQASRSLPQPSSSSSSSSSAPPRLQGRRERDRGRRNPSDGRRLRRPSWRRRGGGPSLTAAREVLEATALPSSSSSSSSSSSPVPQSERQLLLLMLLAQLCSHHTPSPIPFLSHVLSLHSRSILDATAFSFLLDLNLISRVAYDECVRPGATAADIRAAVLPPPALDPDTALVQRPGRGLPPGGAGADPAPLSLSRYARDFVPLRLLGRGTFGSVWSCLSTLTSLPYAVKVVPLEADVRAGGGKVERVLEEVKSMARVRGEWCVRFYAGWLEPGWMRGEARQQQQHLSPGGGPEAEADEEETDTDNTDGPYVGANPYGSSTGFGASGAAFGGDYGEDDYTATNTDTADTSIPLHPSEDFEEEWSSVLHQLPGKGKEKRLTYSCTLYIQMELCTSTTLRSFISSSPPLGPAMLAFWQVAKGLEEVHDAGIIHRDLKPSNVFREEGGRGRYRLGDFGLSTLWDRG